MTSFRSIPYLLFGGIVVFQFLRQKATVSLTTQKFKAAGNCGMCKNRIESALDARGVNKASWDLDSGQVSVTFNPKKISLDDLQQKVADAGHDTAKFKASDEVYEALPACCHYRSA
ncbi:MAG: heavy-metal-associated domain-containing protein [Lewinellaceae bacterium]|nr:heavy-metal-associated domain-containing protein [Saprospiraceae bacterium]MCB9339609.1 heavy-metal-associated domain-containing protein [Lewinellaceae bacterium]